MFDFLSGLLGSEHLILWFVAAFFSGLALNLTPCVYPMIPVTMAFFGGQASGRTGYLVSLGLLYMLGLSLTYAILGLIASQTGALFGSWLQQPAVLIGIAVLIWALALGMFGLYELRPPQWITNRLGQAPAGRFGALAMGLTVGLIAAPCIGPFVLGLLLFISQLGNPALGFGLLFVMGLGMGLPYGFVAVFANRLAALPKAGKWMVWVKRLLGVILIALGLYFIRPLIGPNLAPKPLVAWQPYTHASFQAAREAGRPIVVDVYADWCVPCVELDHTTFRHPEVVAALADVTTLRVDATLEVETEAQELLDQHHIFGVPTILLFDAQGRERSDLRIDGFVPPENFLKRLRALQSF